MNKQIEELYNKLDAQDKIINEQVLEIARLKEKENKYNDLCKKKIGDMSYKELFEFTDGLLDEVWNLEERIDKAIKCIKNRNTTKSKKERFMSGETTLEKVLKILGDKENED